MKRININRLKDRIAEEVEKKLDEAKGESETEASYDRTFAAGMTRAISIINEMESEMEAAK